MTSRVLLFQSTTGRLDSTPSKQLKALIAGHGEKYKYTHDLEELLGAVTTLGENLTVDPPLITMLTDYAGMWRYVEPEPLLPEQRADLQQAVRDIRSYTLRRLGILRPGVDWTEFS